MNWILKVSKFFRSLKYVTLAKDGKIYTKGECIGSWRKIEYGIIHGVFLTPLGRYDGFYADNKTQLCKVIKGKYMEFSALK